MNDIYIYTYPYRIITLGSKDTTGMMHLGGVMNIWVHLNMGRLARR